jgi:hypothetical protein
MKRSASTAHLSAELFVAAPHAVAMEFDLFRERRSSQWVKGGGSAKGNFWLDSALENRTIEGLTPVSVFKIDRVILYFLSIRVFHFILWALILASMRKMLINSTTTQHLNNET